MTATGSSTTVASASSPTASNRLQLPSNLDPPHVLVGVQHRSTPAWYPVSTLPPSLSLSFFLPLFPSHSLPFHSPMSITHTSMSTSSVPSCDRALGSLVPCGNSPQSLAYLFTPPYLHANLGFVPPFLAPGGWALIQNLPNVCSFCLLQTEIVAPENLPSRKVTSSLCAIDRGRICMFTGRYGRKTWLSRSASSRPKGMPCLSFAK